MKIVVQASKKRSEVRFMDNDNFIITHLMSLYVAIVELAVKVTTHLTNKKNQSLVISGAFSITDRQMPSKRCGSGLVLSFFECFSTTSSSRLSSGFKWITGWFKAILSSIFSLLVKIYRRANA
jgi:hypothetical protein